MTNQVSNKGPSYVSGPFSHLVIMLPRPSFPLLVLALDSLSLDIAVFGRGPLLLARPGSMRFYSPSGEFRWMGFTMTSSARVVSQR